MQKPTRNAQLTLLYNNNDISADVTRHLLSFDYTDVVDGKQTDNISIVMEDSQGLWRSGWFPERGATVTAKLTCRDWPGGMVLDCGQFEIDGADFAGPPNPCAITAVAVGVTSSLRRQKVNKAWESISVYEIAAEVARKHGFELVYDCDADPEIDRFDQREQSDLELLGALCDNNGFALQVTDKTIVIFEEGKYDQKPAAITFTRGKGGYKGHRFRVGAADVYTACQVQYIDPKQRIPIAYWYDATASTWSNKRPPSGYVLKLNERCTCEAEAIRLAKAALRKKNKYEATGSIDMLGNPAVLAGDVAAVSGFGRFDQGRYLIERVNHHYGKADGYTTAAEFRSVLVDY